ncbi:MAG: thermopsin family protease, partial [Thermoplasmata archaeon]
HELAFPSPLPPRAYPKAQLLPPASVNVYAFRGSEPAPFGIADYAVDVNGTTYSYGTNEFLGTASISALTTYNSSLGSSATWGTLQLNLVFVFTSGATTYYYWPQDVLFFDSSSNTVQFEDNIWNLSSSGATMESTTITSGNGSVYSSGGGNYYAAGASGQSGSGISLTYPAVVQLRCLAEVKSGSPVVYFQFNDGYGWQTYDTAVFGFTRSVTSALFEVNGNSYTPNNLFQDAELVFGGPGGGSATAITAANVNLSLQFDNGHNLQEVANAFNFGSNTAEAVSGALGTRAVSASTGYLTDRVTAGSGKLGPVYDRGYSAILNGSSKYPSGTYTVNGVLSGAFRNNELNLTLAPGTYTIDLIVNGTTDASVTVNLSAGQYMALQFTPPPRFPIDFVERGLPSGTPWSVSISGAVARGAVSTLNLSEPNGSYTYLVGAVPGFVASSWSGTDVVAADTTTVDVFWTAYRVSGVATEVGLPAGTAWSFRLAGAVYSGIRSTINFTLTNGTYNYTTVGVPGYTTSYVDGQLTVTGTPFSFLVAYARLYYTVEFRPSGLPLSTTWILDFQRVNYTEAGAASLTFHLTNGSYSYSTVAAGPYTAQPASGTVVVTGFEQNVTLRFVPNPARLLITVFPGSANLTVNGSSAKTVNGSYVVNIPPGTYFLNVSAPGYVTQTKTVVVGPGEILPISVNLTALGTPNPHNRTNAPPSGTVSLGTLELLAGAVGVLAIVLIALLAVTRRPRRPSAP